MICLKSHVFSCLYYRFHRVQFSCGASLWYLFCKPGINNYQKKKKKPTMHLKGAISCISKEKMTSFLCPRAAACHPAGSLRGFIMYSRQMSVCYHFLGLCCTMPLENWDKPRVCHTKPLFPILLRPGQRQKQHPHSHLLVSRPYPSFHSALFLTFYFR